MIYILIRTEAPEEVSKINSFIDSIEHFLERMNRAYKCPYGEFAWRTDKTLIKIKLEHKTLEDEAQQILDSIDFTAMYEVWNEDSDEVKFVQTLNGTIIEKGYLIKLLEPKHIWKL